MKGVLRPSKTTKSPSSVDSRDGARSVKLPGRYSFQKVGGGLTCESADMI